MTSLVPDGVINVGSPHNIYIVATDENIGAMLGEDKASRIRIRFEVELDKASRDPLGHVHIP